MSNKLYFEAIRALPPEWITDKTDVICVMGAIVVAAHPDRVPMQFRRDTARWEAIPELPADQAAVMFATPPTPTKQ